MIIHRGRGRACVLALLALVWGAMTPPGAFAATNTPVKRVLIIDSFGRYIAPFNAVSAAFRATLARESPEVVDIDEIPFDTARYVEAKQEALFAHFIQHHFVGRQLDLVVPINFPAASFAVRYRQQLFAEVPLLLTSVEQRRLQPNFLTRQTAVVPSMVDLTGPIDTILQVLPETKDIVVVFGASALEKFWLAELRRRLAKFAGRVNFTWYNELSFEEMKRRAAVLPPGSAIYYGLLIVDAAGVPYENEAAVQSLRAVAKAPIFGLYENQLGMGAVGGRLLANQDIGVAAARVALRILRGEVPSSIPTQPIVASAPVFDWRELQRWKIAEARLPPGSTVRFRAPSLWQQHRREIVVGLGLFVVQAALIAVLLVERRRRRRVNAVLRQSEASLRRLVEGTAAVPWLADAETWAFTYVGPQAVKLLGYPLEQWYQKDFWASHVHPEDREYAINTCAANSQMPEDFEFEYRMIAASGEIVWLHDIVKCEHRNGKPAQLRGFMLDITERKQAVESLRESEERISLAAESANLGLWSWDLLNDSIWATEKCRALYGISPEQAIGLQTFYDRLIQEDIERVRRAFDLALRDRSGFAEEYRIMIPNGVIRWLGSFGRGRYDRDGEPIGMLGVSIDITARKQMEAMIKEEREFLRQVIDVDPNFIFAKDREGHFTLANQAVAEAYGTTVEALVGKTDADFNPNHEEVEFFHRLDREVIDTRRERFIAEEQITDAKGQVRWLQTVKRPIIANDGSVGQLLGSSTDITRRREAEREAARQRDELAHVTRTATLGELAASLAHELYQPLTAILSNAQAAQRFLSFNPVNLDEVREILQDIVDDDTRAGNVIRRMRALVKKEKLTLTPTDLATVIREVVALVHGDALLRNIEVCHRMDPTPVVVRADKVYLQQVLLNLLLNAFEAVKDVAVGARRVATTIENHAPGLVKVGVTDNGHGLSGAMLDKIFEPFFTTKREGMGMGLCISRSIVEAHGGRLWAENNKPGCGATFFFTVPSADADAISIVND